MPEVRKTGSEFIVKVDGIKLPADVEARVNGEIQALVLREIAKIDYKGDLQSKIPRKEWLGIWLSNLKTFDPNAATLKVAEVTKEIKSPGK